jgi:hypothetical protein
MGGYMTFNLENFRIFFAFCGITNFLGQLLLLKTFPFDICKEETLN